ncbi:hypothetical protein FPOAC2_13363 [Fusarium poae]|uniref:uncharacterized protein n=1 Tax=Fusarium poae TaxID=36050 RepID=UPI001D03E26C|nr:uncharacterized protein FPOAC1_013757 [Fusarium poae]KAG8664419.1 hypothetical protein FPOAC1_013757 [Fusarium poae]
MEFPSRYQIDIPDVDVLTYVFGTPTPGDGPFVYLDAETQTQGFRKSELETYVKKLAGGLRATKRIKNDDVILAYTQNSIWYPIIVLGAICAGGIFTGANPGYTSIELTQHLTISGATCIFTDSERLEAAVEAADAAALPRSSIVLLDDGREPALVDLHRIQDFLASPHSWEVIKDPQVLTEKVAVLNFSSGTTGNPKACMITHRNLVANAEQTLHLDEVARERSSSMNHSSHETHCAFLPLYHASGLLTYCIVNLRRSCTTVVMRKFSLRLLLSTIQRFRVTSLFLAPPVVLMLVESDLLSQYDLSSVELLLCGGAPLQPEQSRKLEAVFGDGRVRSRQGWGMTEATMAVTLFAPDEFDPSHKGVGYLVANMQMKIVADDGSQVGYCEEGEAFVRGPNVFKGYYKNQSASQQAFDWMGWMRTGDIVTIQRSGLVTVVNRKKELIKVKGFQVAPSELEGHLLEHPGVKDCAVTRIILNGQEHPQAHIVARDSDVTAESIMEFLQGRLSAHKRITGGIVFTKSIPKSASGKILRWMLQDPGHARLTHL